MSRGNIKPIGSEFTNKNGYTYVKTEKGWEPKHKVILEGIIGRALMDDERAFFVDGNRFNLSADNIGLKQVKPKSGKSRLAEIEFEIGELRAKLRDLRDEKAKLLSAAESSREV